MYLFGTFIGEKSKIIIDAASKNKDVEKFLKDNPEFQAKITNEKEVRYQYGLMGIEYDKPVDKKA